MTASTTLPNSPLDRRAQFAALAVCSLAVAGGVLAASGFPAKVWLAPAGLAPIAWIAAAAGYGRVLRRLLFPNMSAGDPRRVPLALGLGVAFALVLVNLLATCGCLPAHTWSRAVWWTGMAIGWLLAGLSWPFVRGLFCVRRMAIDPLLWCALPALAALALAAAIPPGLAWSTEFGGYDALAYHLELPKEWLAAGALEPLRNNVYSAFPSFVEGAYLQFFALSSGPAPAHAMAMAPQMMHALLAVCAAWMVAATAETLAGGDPRRRAWARAIGWCGFLGIPWVIVTASLAYNEMAVLLMLAAAMLAWTARASTGAWRIGIALGLLLGAAVGAKLVAAGMVVMPFACWALLTARTTDEASAGISLSEANSAGASATQAPRSAPNALALASSVVAASLTALLVLAPWLIRNHLATGSATFPFAVPLLGTGSGWWDAEQMTRFAAGHGAPAGVGIGARFIELRNAAFLQGFGAAPNTDPWLPQWSIAFWIGSAAIMALLVRARRGGLALGAMLILQLAFWMFATHMKSRFLLPCAVPLTVAVAVLAAPVIAHHARRMMVGLTVLLLSAWSLQPALLMRLDPRTDNNVELCAALRAGAMDIGPGTAALAQESAALGDVMPLAWIANWLLPPEAILGSEGDADVFWCRTAPVTGTVWDGGPLARVLRAHPHDPVAAARALSTDEHLTHLAIGESMLARWKASGWIDPILTPDRVRAVAALLNPVAHTASGGVVYKVPLAH
ncbi:MAG: hypothetical protein DWH86_02070 [Planctomycetota bacterium]|nr:MAG: hypothetical protein DWH86_02070 [Planctomycetota bacterium]